MPQATPPARLFAIFAREAPVGIIFRRGPTRWVQLIHWDTANDVFTPGQWFKGRVFERRCDLSPDGKHLIYFVSKINARTLRDKEYTYSWTAISRPPYFTALALFPKGDSWAGGGSFRDNQTVWLNHHPQQGAAHPNHQPPRHIKVVPNPMAHGEDNPVYYNRLKRDGWVMTQPGKFDYSWDTGWVAAEPQILQRKTRRCTLSYENWGYTWRTKRIEKWFVTTDSGRHALSNAQWAEFDQRGQIRLAKEGKIFTTIIAQNGVVTLDETADFNAHQPEAIISPEWARRW